MKPVMYGRADGGPVVITADQWDRGDTFRKDVVAKVQKEFNVPLYGQDAINQLTADAVSLRERMVELEHQRNDLLNREWRANCRAQHAETERDVLARRLEKLEALLRKPNIVICESLGHHEAGIFLLGYDDGRWDTSGDCYLTLDDALEALVP